MNKIHLVYLGIGISVTALVIGAANLGITLADVAGMLNLVGDK